MSTVVPQSELAKRALAWICEHCGENPEPAALRKAIEQASARFNLGPLEEEFLERFFREQCAQSGQAR